MIRSLLVAGAVVVCLALGLPGDETGPAPAVVLMDPQISWVPEAPAEGTLFRIRVQASPHTPLLGVHGAAAGEELHFRRIDDQLFESFAAAPIGAGPAIDAEFRVVYEAEGEESFTSTIPVTPGVYDHEELRVAPRFGAPPSPEDQAQLERDRASARKASQTAHRTSPRWDVDVMMPRDSRVTSGFGDGRVFNGRVSSRHMGLDLRGARGDTVLAAAAGDVLLVEPFLLAGNVVYLNHGAGLLSAYFHLSEQLVEVGERVSAGQAIGLVGATGRVTGPHLHWVVRYGRTSVDPRSLLTVMLPVDSMP
ncbi:MAG: M23 family metallopeptidase [Longimicrobiales bacterium]|nr:M23 family metallopeptidase [Longimicrobiales bacterium]